MTSSQPIITPDTLNFTPDNLRCYSYGGPYSLKTSEQTVMYFSTNSETLVGWLFVSGGVIPGSSLGGITTFEIKINGVTTIWLKTETAQEDSPLNTKVKLILPPFSTIEVITDSDATNAAIFTTTAFTGKAYGMIETGYQ